MKMTVLNQRRKLTKKKKQCRLSRKDYWLNPQNPVNRAPGIYIYIRGEREREREREREIHTKYQNNREFSKDQGWMEGFREKVNGDYFYYFE